MQDAYTYLVGDYLSLTDLYRALHPSFQQRYNDAKEYEKLLFALNTGDAHEILTIEISQGRLSELLIESLMDRNTELLLAVDKHGTLAWNDIMEAVDRVSEEDVDVARVLVDPTLLRESSDNLLGLIASDLLYPELGGEFFRLLRQERRHVSPDKARGWVEVLLDNILGTGDLVELGALTDVLLDDRKLDAITHLVREYKAYNQMLVEGSSS